MLTMCRFSMNSVSKIANWVELASAVCITVLLLEYLPLKKKPIRMRWVFSHFQLMMYQTKINWTSNLTTVQKPKLNFLKNTPLKRTKKTNPEKPNLEPFRTRIWLDPSLQFQWKDGIHKHSYKKKFFFIPLFHAHLRYYSPIGVGLRSPAIIRAPSKKVICVTRYIKNIRTKPIPI